MLPNFIVIGAGKAGTTSLWGYLSGHPEVFTARQKELNFFTTEHNWSLGLPWYEQQFEGAGLASAVGEASGNYTNWPEYAGVPERMARVIPDVRLLYVIRHPIERMVSAYRYLRIEGREHRTMEAAFRERQLYLNVSRYSSQIEQFLEHFARAQLHVVVSEDLRDRREETMRRVFSFLEVDPTIVPASLVREYNRTDQKVRKPRAILRWAGHAPGYRALASKAPPRLKRAVGRVAKTETLNEEDSLLTDELRRHLQDELRSDTARLRVHLGPEFHCWGLA